MFIETSAKAGYNVKQLFRRVAAALPGMEDSVPKAAGEDREKPSWRPPIWVPAPIVSCSSLSPFDPCSSLLLHPYGWVDWVVALLCGIPIRDNPMFG